MKHIVIIVLAALISAQLFAQDFSQKQSGEVELNKFYIDLTSRAERIDGKWGLFGGMRAGYNLTENVSFGLTAHGLIPDIRESNYINQTGKDELTFGYGGIESNYKYNLSENFYLTGTFMAGMGRIALKTLGGHDYFFVFEPGTSVNFRITEWFGLGYSVNYRLATGVNYADFYNKSFSGWSMELGFKFGF
ncbi:MAG: hypothetical protein HND52_16675 [Ignavibacteriae bacterium]|nr:hypothetical protein [Ignavibacteriota bacterium]NOG99594.1 hypothetical protein [Ignavibacteriota bacterium]